MTHSCDVAIIGGGIVGLATARALAQSQPQLKLLLLEKEAELATHQTGRNSGVIHSGIYYKPGSLKAKLCTEGARSMVAFARENGIAHEICGKLIVATLPRELPALQTLWERGHANGIAGLQWLDPAQIKEREPNISGLKGILVPGTGIIDYVGVARAIAAQLEASSASVLKGARVTSHRPAAQAGQLQTLGTTAGEVACRYVINCGGLYADKLARMMGVTPGVAIVPFRGEYYMIRPERQDLVRHLVYPVPDPQFPFLGVHFTRTVDGHLEAGPNAVFALAREGYSKWAVHPGEALGSLLYSGFLRIAVRHWRMGLGETYRSFNKGAFTRALQKLAPSITSADLMPGPCGVRAQCVQPDGFLVDDFRMLAAPGAIHVLNVPSPAATASLAIGPYIVKMFEDQVLKNS